MDNTGITEAKALADDIEYTIDRLDPAASRTLQRVRRELSNIKHAHSRHDAIVALRTLENVFAETPIAPSVEEHQGEWYKEVRAYLAAYDDSPARIDGKIAAPERSHAGSPWPSRPDSEQSEAPEKNRQMQD